MSGRCEACGVDRAVYEAALEVGEAARRWREAKGQYGALGSGRERESIAAILDAEQALLESIEALDEVAEQALGW